VRCLDDVSQSVRDLRSHFLLYLRAFADVVHDAVELGQADDLRSGVTREQPTVGHWHALASASSGDVTREKHTSVSGMTPIQHLPTMFWKWWAQVERTLMGPVA
jgi:hypothetical protein